MSSYAQADKKVAPYESLHYSPNPSSKYEHYITHQGIGAADSDIAKLQNVESISLKIKRGLSSQNSRKYEHDTEN